MTQILSLIEERRQSEKVAAAAEERGLCVELDYTTVPYCISISTNRFQVQWPTSLPPSLLAQYPLRISVINGRGSNQLITHLPIVSDSFKEKGSSEKAMDELSKALLPLKVAAREDNFPLGEGTVSGPLIERS